jgi:hypothetical protein
MSIETLSIQLKTTLINKSGFHKNITLVINEEETDIIRFNIEGHTQLFLDGPLLYKVLKILTNNMENNHD